MRRLVLTLSVGLLVGGMFALSGSATADHVAPVQDALDCAQSPAPGGPSQDPGQTDRGAVCESDGNPANGPEFYAGGEAATESAYPDNPEHQAGDQCGAVVVNGTVLQSTRPDDPSTSANEGLDWDWVHTHDPDGVPNSGDETSHHHTCD